MQPHKRLRIGKGGKGGSQVNVSPKHIPYGFRIRIKKSRADSGAHTVIVPGKAQEAKNAARDVDVAPNKKKQYSESMIELNIGVPRMSAYA